MPPTEKECYVFAKKATDLVETSINAYGDGNAHQVIDCFIEAIKRTKKGSVETMCTEEALIDGWTKLTNKELESLKTGADIISENGKNTVYEYNEQVTSEKVNAK